MKKILWIMKIESRGIVQMNIILTLEYTICSFKKRKQFCPLSWKQNPTVNSSHKSQPLRCRSLFCSFALISWVILNKSLIFKKSNLGTSMPNLNIIFLALIISCFQKTILCLYCDVIKCLTILFFCFLSII